uniref:hypothetical protein n=1 Tax=Hominenteromicrobium sp. TaxID=3073581 RepID=UPI003A902914
MQQDKRHGEQGENTQNAVENELCTVLFRSARENERINPQIASSSWTPSGRKLGLPQPLRLRKQCQGMLQRVLLECSTPDSSSEG